MCKCFAQFYFGSEVIILKQFKLYKEVNIEVLIFSSNDVN